MVVTLVEFSITRVKILISMFSLDFYIPRVLRTNYHGVGKLIYFHWMAQRIPISLQVCQVYCIPCVFIISFYSLSYLFTFWHNKFFNGSESAVTEWKWHVAYNYALKHRSQQYSLLIEAEWLLKLSKKRNCV